MAEAGLNDRIAVRKGDGLAVIKANEVDVITIAGMGGALIASILEQGKDKLVSVKQLVLQPNVGEDILRRWLIEHQWVLTSEHIMEEDGKIYEILTAVPDSVSPLKLDELYQPWKLPDSSLVLTQDLLMQLGPLLVKAPNEIFFINGNWRFASLRMCWHKWHDQIRNPHSISGSNCASKLNS